MRIVNTSISYGIVTIEIETIEHVHMDYYEIKRMLEIVNLNTGYWYVEYYDNGPDVIHRVTVKDVKLSQIFGLMTEEDRNAVAEGYTSTCISCRRKHCCDLAFDPYCTHGDCLHK